MPSKSLSRTLPTEMKTPFSKFWPFLISMGIIAFSFSSHAHNFCASLAEIEKIKLHPINTGILTRSLDGKIILTFGSIFDSHSILLNHASYSYGTVGEILWAGELKTEKDKIQVINETAGIIIRNTPAIRSKISDLQNLVNLYEKYPKLRQLFSTKPTLIKFDPSLQGQDLHLFSGLEDIARFRHDVQGVIASFTALADGVEAGYMSEANLKDLNSHLKKRASEMLELISIADQFHYGTLNPADPNRESLKDALHGLSRDGFGLESNTPGAPEVAIDRLKTIRAGALFLSHKENGIYSIFIE